MNLRKIKNLWNGQIIELTNFDYILLRWKTHIGDLSGIHSG